MTGPAPRATGDREFTAFASMAMAATALSIDLMLPAFGAIRRSLHLAPDSTAVSGLVTTFMLGLASMQLVYGTLSDRVGRRRVLRVGWMLYAVGAAATALAPNLGLMLVARFVWGAGAAGPRTTAMAMIRDRTAGERMAKQMSFVMAVFLIVPILAPSLGNAILHVGGWRWVFGSCVAFAVIQLVWSVRIAETLAPERRVASRLRDVGRGAAAVLRTPGTGTYTFAISALFASFNAYLAGSQLIFDEVFHQGAHFPLLFGSMGAAMALGVLLNGRIVERVGLARMNLRVLVGYTALSVGLVVLGMVTGGTPPLGWFLVLLAPMLAAHNVLSPNLTSSAMRPLGDFAGTASAVIGSLSIGAGAVIGAVVDHAYDHTMMPLAISFLAAGVLALAAVARRRGVLGARPSLVTPVVVTAAD